MNKSRVISSFLIGFVFLSFQSNLWAEDLIKVFQGCPDSSDCNGYKKKHYYNWQGKTKEACSDLKERNWCISSSKFDYKTSGNGKKPVCYVTEFFCIPDDGNPSLIQPMDIDGDAQPEIVLGPSSNGNFFVMRSTGTDFIDEGAVITTNYGGWVNLPDHVRSMDVNGDGSEDIVIGPNNKGKWYVLRSLGTTFDDDGAWISNAFGGWPSKNIHPADVNGDGMTDLVLGPNSSGKWYVLRSTGSSFVNEGTWITGAYGKWDKAGSRIRTMDINADGRDDIVIGPNGSGKWYVLRSNGTKFINDGAWVSGAYGNWGKAASRIRPMDVNGDGRDDIVIGPNRSGQWSVLRSTGAKFINDGAWISGAYGNWDKAASRIRPMDINGDGRDDIVIGPNGSGKWYVLKSTGSKFTNDGEWISGAYGSWGK